MNQLHLAPLKAKALTILLRALNLSLGHMGNENRALHSIHLA